VRHSLLLMMMLAAKSAAPSYLSHPDQRSQRLYNSPRILSHTAAARLDRPSSRRCRRCCRCRHRGLLPLAAAPLGPLHVQPPVLPLQDPEGQQLLPCQHRHNTRVRRRQYGGRGHLLRRRRRRRLRPTRASLLVAALATTKACCCGSGVPGRQWRGRGERWWRRGQGGRGGWGAGGRCCGGCRSSCCSRIMTGGGAGGGAALCSLVGAAPEEGREAHDGSRRSLPGLWIAGVSWN
jgi:hypothetical protein